jgi:hypothetical protein
MVRGLANTDGAAFFAVRAGAPFATVVDIWRRSNACMIWTTAKKKRMVKGRWSASQTIPSRRHTPVAKCSNATPCPLMLQEPRDSGHQSRSHLRHKRTCRTDIRQRQLARTAPDATSDARACERPGVLPAGSRVTRAAKHLRSIRWARSYGRNGAGCRRCRSRRGGERGRAKGPWPDGKRRAPLEILEAAADPATGLPIGETSNNFRAAPDGLARHLLALRKIAGEGLAVFQHVE